MSRPPHNDGGYVATLACHSRIDGTPHTLAFRSMPPSLGETLWCARCADWSVVAEAPYIWRGVCRSCTWKSRPDTRKSYATEGAERHVRRHRDHTVQLRQGRTVIQTWVGVGRKSLEERLENLLTAR